ncbi:MAG: sodium-dependent transporter [Bacteroidota bacterium]
MRSHFNSRLGFIMAAAGSAIGLGNIWKFPFEVGESGGAAFIIVYLFFCFVLCFPILVSEIAIGRRAQRNAFGAFKVLGFPRWAVIGLLQVVVSLFILSFYNVVAGWSFGYFIEMLIGNFAIGEQFPQYVQNVPRIMVYSLLFMVVTGYIVAQGVSAGIEKYTKLLMPILILIILGLAGYALTLPGAKAGLTFYLVPDVSKITLDVIYNALGHAFFSLSLGLGGLMTYGSYLDQKANILSSAVAVTFMDVMIAFMAGFMLFPFVFSQGIATEGGVGLVFMALPKVFASLGSVWGIIIGGLFFLLLSFAALTSTVSILEVSVAYLRDEHRFSRVTAVVVSATVIFLLGIPSLLANGSSEFFTNFMNYGGVSVDFMTFISDLSSNTFLPLAGLLISLFVGYIWRPDQLIKELSSDGYQTIPIWVAVYLKIALRYICPVILSLIFLFTVLEKFFGVQVIG